MTASQLDDPGTTGQADPTKVVGRRCAQFVLDTAIIVVPILVIGIAAGYLLLPLASSLVALQVITIVLVAAIFVLYWLGVIVVFILRPHRHGGQTPAMRWLGLQVVTLDGTRPRLSAFVIRMLLQVVDGFLFGLVGIFLMLISPRHQRFGDMVTNTVVVRKR
jgi:uncharacterized RDD family membrane protein YckC